MLGSADPLPTIASSNPMATEMPAAEELQRQPIPKFLSESVDMVNATEFDESGLLTPL
jgi:hypothetical protein